MSPQSDKKVLIELAQKGDQDAVAKLVEDNMRLVYKLAKKYRHSMVEQEDLVAFGTIGLLKAIQQFDMSYETQFSTYAVPLILGEIRRYFRDDGAIKVARSLKELYFSIERVRQEYESANHSSPSLEYIAKFLSVNYEDVVMALDAHNYPTSLETPIDEENLLLGDTIGEEENEKILENLDLKSAISSLPKKEQLFVKMRFFDDMKQGDIAKRFYISQVQVSRMEKKILSKLKHLLSQ